MFSPIRDWSQFGPNAALIASFYELYLTDRSLVDPQWADFFDRLGDSAAVSGAVESNGFHSDLRNGQPASSSAVPAADADLLTESYREFGHLEAKISPIEKGVDTRPRLDCLHPQPLKPELSEHLAWLRSVYCGSIGFEFMHLVSAEERGWLVQRIETSPGRYDLSEQQKLRILRGLVEAEAFENELHRKYVGQTRFSSEGGDTCMPMLDLVREEGPQLGLKEVVIGMAHRARLNVLLNTLGKPLEEVLAECEDQSLYSVVGSGDVKYHMGYSQLYHTESGADILLSLAPNPSHLEFVNPVVEGIARARQDLFLKRNRSAVLPVLIHGDAAFCGQGIVPETLNLSLVEGYSTGGTLHIIFNNQVGFTTYSAEGKSSIYCSDLAKAYQAPIFHVNAEDPEACCWITRLAIEFRQRFGRDVVVDMVCYRKYGHNEGDDPSFTQPTMYAEIKSKRAISTLFISKLAEQGLPAEELSSGWREQFRQRFNTAHELVKSQPPGEACLVHGRLKSREPLTKVPVERLREIAHALISYPEGFSVHPKLKQILERRAKSLDDSQGIDWGFGEVLAFGSLVQEGVHVRLSGQDCGRGTFSQRHLMLSDYLSGAHYLPFSALPGGGFEVYNSPLSENAVMGFEFGFGTILQPSLVLWEAQYGDFCNGAQVIIDQFLANSEEAWGQRSGIVLLLPHGYEGQGPEHSTARIERFLQLSAEGNMTVAYPSTSAQYFHLLRNHALSAVRRPLVVFTPKSLLRSSAAASQLNEFVNGAFNPVLGTSYGKSQVKTLLLMSGKIFFEVDAELKKQDRDGVRCVRIERFYPFPEEELLAEIKAAGDAAIAWVQEEPENMGGWQFVERELRAKAVKDLVYLGRPASASAATGSHRRHSAEQKQLVAEVISFVGR